MCTKYCTGCDYNSISLWIQKPTNIVKTSGVSVSIATIEVVSISCAILSSLNA